MSIPNLKLIFCFCLFRKEKKLVKNEDHYVVLDVGGERFTAKRDTDHCTSSVVNRFRSFFENLKKKLPRFQNCHKLRFAFISTLQ